MKLILLPRLMVALTTISGVYAMADPLKVYILAGQSNMVGMANISTFEHINR